MEIRQATAADIPRILDLQRKSYPLLSTISAWGTVHLESHQAHFAQGQFVAVSNDHVVGHSAAFIVSSRDALRPHSFREITGRGLFTTHDPNGDTLYGAEIMVDPDFRRRGIGGKFYARRFLLVREMGLRYFVAGGRLPGYEEQREKLSPEEYVALVVEGRLRDRVLSTQLRAGLKVHAVLKDYLSDPRSGNFASLLFWENADLKQDPKDGRGVPSATPRRRSRVRV